MYSHIYMYMFIHKELKLNYPITGNVSTKHQRLMNQKPSVGNGI